MIVTALYKVYAIWTFCCTENKAFMKFASGFIGPQILNFERSLSLSPGPQSCHVPPCNISLGSSSRSRIYIFS